MPTKLEPATQTKKVKSLPDDLKKIADRLIAKKFGEEVVEQKASDPFRQGFPDGHHTLYREPTLHNRERWWDVPGDAIRSGYDFPNKRRIFTLNFRQPLLRVVQEAYGALYQSSGRRPSRMVCGPQFYKRMMANPEIYGMVAFKSGISTAEIYGMKVDIDSSVSEAVLVAYA